MLHSTVMSGQLVPENTEFEAALHIPSITRHLTMLRSRFEEIDKSWPALHASSDVKPDSKCCDCNYLA